MAERFIDSLKAEIGELEREAARARAKLEAARNLLAVLVGPAAPPPSPAAGTLFQVEKPPAVRPMMPERQRALDAARDFLTGKTEPMPTSIIYGYIRSLGLDVPGQNPKNNLSAMLSNSDAFKSHGRLGWTLNQPSDPRDSEAADDEGVAPASTASAEPRLTSGGAPK